MIKTRIRQQKWFKNKPNPNHQNYCTWPTKWILIFKQLLVKKICNAANGFLIKKIGLHRFRDERSVACLQCGILYEYFYSPQIILYQPTIYVPFQKHYCHCGAQRVAKTGNIAVRGGLCKCFFAVSDVYLPGDWGRVELPSRQHSRPKTTCGSRVFWPLGSLLPSSEIVKRTMCIGCII